MKIMVINGPNLNMVGIREKEIYGYNSFSEICDYINDESKKRSHNITLVQSNSEGEIIDYIHKAYFENYHGLIINPGAYTHYSYAIHDAIKSIENIPTVEVHLSNIHSREDFRKDSKIAPACIGQICGFGRFGYIFALDAIEEHLKNK